MRPHVIWWDNFNRAYAVAMQSLNKEAHKLCNWTGKGARTVHGTINVDHIDTRLIANDQQPAFPADFLKRERWVELDKLLIDMTSPSGIKKFMKRNWCNKHTINRVPIGAKIDKKVHPKLHERANDGRTTLTNFYPVQMSSENIGSNLGLLQLLFDINKEHDNTASREQRYQAICSDCNIFLRILKVRA